MMKTNKDEEMIQLFASRLSQAMELAGIIPADLARMTGISKSMISMYASTNHEPKQNNILKMAAALGVSPAWLMGADDTNELLETLKNDPDVRMVAKISGTLTEQGKKDLRKYAELLRNQRDRMSQD